MRKGTVCYGLTGGAVGNLDAVLSTGLAANSLSITYTSTKIYFHYWDSVSALPESSPDVIKPDNLDVGEAGRWLLIFSEGILANAYYPGYSAADQGITGSGNTVKHYVDTIGTTNKATIYLRHNSGGANTDYTFSTAETITSNITLAFEPGARLAIATGITVTIQGDVDSGLNQIFSLTGTGAVASLKTSRPEWFGDNAVPGTTNMTAIIIAASSSLATNGTMELSPTTYYINTAAGMVVSKAGIKVRGNGAAFTTGTTVGNAPTLTFSGADSVIENLKVTGDDTGWVHTDDLSTELRRNIQVSGARSKVNNVEAAEGIVGIDTTGVDIEVYGCYVHHTTVKSGYATDTNYCAGIMATGNRTKVHHNRVVGYGQNVLAGDDIVGLIVHDNSLEDADDNGIYVSSGTYCNVHHNRVTGFDSSGIKVRGSYHVVDSNLITSAAGGAAAGVAVTGNGAPTGNYNGYGTIVSGNRINGTYFGAGIATAVQDLGYIKNPQFVNNWISMTDSPGIVVNGGESSGMIVKGNFIEGHTLGIELFATTASALYHDNSTVADNVVIGGTDDNCYLVGVRYSTISNNQFKNSTGATDGILMTTSTFNRFIGNDCTGNGRYGINESTSSASNEYYNNSVTGNATVPMVITSTASMVVPGNTIVTGELAGNYTIRPGAASVYIIDPGGAHRNVNPSGTFPLQTITIINVADAAENLVFDTAGINVTVAQNKRCIFSYTGSAWTQITAVAP